MGAPPASSPADSRGLVARSADSLGPASRSATSVSSVVVDRGLVDRRERARCGGPRRRPEPVGRALPRAVDQREQERRDRERDHDRGERHCLRQRVGISSVGAVADDRRSPGRAPAQQQQVRAVAERMTPMSTRDRLRSAAVDAGGEQHADSDDEDDVRAHVDHGTPPSQPAGLAFAPTCAGTSPSASPPTASPPTGSSPVSARRSISAPRLRRMSSTRPTTTR